MLVRSNPEKDEKAKEGDILPEYATVFFGMFSNVAIIFNIIEILYNILQNKFP